MIRYLECTASIIPILCVTNRCHGIGSGHCAGDGGLAVRVGSRIDQVIDQGQPLGQFVCEGDDFEGA